MPRNHSFVTLFVTSTKCPFSIGMSRGKANLMELQGNAIQYRRKVAALITMHGRLITAY
jgi:hypothetical protein